MIEKNILQKISTFTKFSLNLILYPIISLVFKDSFKLFSQNEKENILQRNQSKNVNFNGYFILI
jgi:hypothetical protein